MCLIGISMMAISGFVFTKLTTETTGLQHVTLDSVEVLSACEVSADPTKNKGYCAANFNSDGDSCTTTGDPGNVRCSGNTNP